MCFLLSFWENRHRPNRSSKVTPQITDLCIISCPDALTLLLMSWTGECFKFIYWVVLQFSLCKDLQSIYSQQDREEGSFHSRQQSLSTESCKLHSSSKQPPSPSGKSFQRQERWASLLLPLCPHYLLLLWAGNFTDRGDDKYTLGLQSYCTHKSFSPPN